MAKYKLLICDDAAIIRTSLASLVQLHFPEMELVGLYSDGDEALAHLEREAVDLIIADICMERVDGLEVAKYVFEQKLHTRVIIITGYQEFEYARKAVNYQVSALVTKPMDSSLLIGAVRDAVAVLDAFFSRVSAESRRILSDYKQIAQALRLFIEGGVRLDLLGQDIRSTLFDAHCKRAMLLQFLLPPSSPCVPAGAWDSLVPRKNDRFEIYVLSCREKGACCLVLDLAEDAAALQEALSPTLSAIADSFSRQYSVNTESLLLPFADVSRTFSTELFGDFAAYLSGIPELNPEKTRKRAAQIAADADQDTLRIMLSLMLIYARTEVPALDIAPYNAALSHARTPAETSRLLQKLSDALTSAMASNEAFVAIVRKYIYRNIADEALSLEMVSKHFGYSAEHFSRKFRQMTGITFQSYLGDVRMERAKELLGDPESAIAWVSAQVGFKDPAYFSKVFKKHTGLLPKEYKNHITK